MTFPFLVAKALAAKASLAIAIAASALLPLAPALARNFDFKSIGTSPAVLYDAPSLKGGKLYIAPQGMPVEVVLSYGEWVKVRDASGDMAWTEAKLLSPRRMVVVRSANAKIRPTPDESGIPLMSADKGVLLELADPGVAQWVKVRHKDGIIGYIKAIDIWGI